MPSASLIMESFPCRISWGLAFLEHSLGNADFEKGMFLAFWSRKVGPGVFVSGAQDSKGWQQGAEVGGLLEVHWYVGRNALQITPVRCQTLSPGLTLSPQPNRKEAWRQDSSMWSPTRWWCRDSSRSKGGVWSEPPRCLCPGRASTTATASSWTWAT